jgi:HK97 family phage portal protein
MCAGEELKLYKKSDRRKNGSNAEALGEHEVYDLLENPCPTFPELDGWTLRYLTFAYIDLVGECGWLKVRDGKRIIALLPIPKAWILTKPTLGNHYYQILPYGTLGGMSLTVAPEDFVYFKDVNLEDPYGNGKGLSESIADELETDEYASKYQKNFFFNDATPPYVVTGYQGNEQGADRLKKTLKEKLGGFRKAREPAILTGAMDIKPIGTSPKELDMVESRKFLRDECLQHYQLPPEVFGIVENSNRATIDSSFYLTQKNVLIPRLRFFERVINAQLLNEFDDLCCYHDVRIIEDETLNLQVYQFGVLNGCITKEQYCEHFGINPNPEEGHYLVPNSGAFVNVDEEFELPEVPDEEPLENEPTEEGKSVAGYMIKQSMEHEEWKAKIWNGFNSKALRQEEPFIKSIQKIAARQKSDIGKEIERLEQVNDATVNNLAND